MTDFITLDNALKAKASCWEYEEEARLIYFSKDMSKWVMPDWIGQAQQNKSKTQNYNDYISLDGFNVKAVYMGCKISNKDKSEIIHRLHTCNSSVQLFQIMFKIEDITQLEAIRI